MNTSWGPIKAYQYIKVYNPELIIRGNVIVNLGMNYSTISAPPQRSECIVFSI